MKLLPFFVLIVALVVSICASLTWNVVSATTSTSENNDKRKRISPCMWHQKLEESVASESSSAIQTAFNELYNHAVKFEIETSKNNTVKKQQQQQKAMTFETVVALILYTTSSSSSSTTEKESSGTTFPIILDRRESAKISPLSQNFMRQLDKRQSSVSQTCSLSTLQLTLEIVSSSSTAAVSSSPVLYTIVPAPSSSSTSGIFHQSSTNDLPFHYYNAEIHPFVLHNFIMGLRDLLPIMSSKAIPSSSSSNKIQDTEDFMIQQDKNEDVIDSIFKKIPKTNRGISRGGILRTAESASDIIFARDYDSTAEFGEIAKRVIFVVNDAAVLPLLALKRNMKNDESLEKNQKLMSNPILAAASEGRALFIWYRFQEETISREIDAMTEKYGKIESFPSSITRVNISLWSHCFRIRARKNNNNNNEFETTPSMFVLSDARIDDGVIRFLGNWSSVLGVSSVSASSASSEVALAQSYKATAMATNNNNNNAKNENDKSVTTSSFLLHKYTANEAVDFVRQYANPGSALEPIFPADFKSMITPFRFVALFLVQTMGYDQKYNHVLARSIYKEFVMVDEVKKGCRTGGLVPFRRKVLTYDGESTQPILVPIVIANAILQGDLAAKEFAVSNIVPCFLFYDRRDRRILTDRRKFEQLQPQLMSGGFDRELEHLSAVFEDEENLGIPLKEAAAGRGLKEEEGEDSIDKIQEEKSSSSARLLADAAIDVWKRAEDRSILNNGHHHRRRNTIVEEPTSLAGKVMQWIEDHVPYVRHWRLWMRVDPEEMLFVLLSFVLAFVIVIVLTFLFYLIKLPENQTFKDIISDDKEKREAAKERVHAIAKMKAEEKKKK